MHNNSFYIPDPFDERELTEKKQKLIRISNRTMLQMFLFYLSDNHRYDNLTKDILDSNLSHKDSIPILLDQQLHPKLYELINMIQKNHSS